MRFVRIIRLFLKLKHGFQIEIYNRHDKTSFFCVIRIIANVTQPKIRVVVVGKNGNFSCPSNSSKSNGNPFILSCVKFSHFLFLAFWYIGFCFSFENYS